MVRTLLALVVALVVAIGVASAGAAAPLRVGGFVVAPLIMGEPDRPLTGALREFLEQKGVADEVPLQWMPPTTLARTIRQLQDGSLDIVLLSSGAGARQQGAAPFRWTYLKTQPHLAVPADSPLREMESLDQLAGMHVGWLAGPPLSPGLAKSGAHWQRLDVMDWQMANLERMRAGELDAVYFENPYSPRYYAQAAGVPVRLVRLPMPPRAFFMLYSLKADRAAIARFDRAASAAFAGREFRDFLERYLADMAPRARRGQGRGGQQLAQ